MSDYKYKSYDRGIEVLLNKLQVNDPSSKDEIMKHEVFKTAGFTPIRPCKSPFTYLTLTAEQYSRLAKVPIAMNKQKHKSHYQPKKKSSHSLTNSMSYAL